MICKSFVCAIRFLTVLPIGKSREFSSEELACSMAFYPLVGYLIGAFSFGFYTLATPYFPPWLAGILAVIFGIFLTGALHLDGFADSCDGFYAGKTKDEILRIMKDSHIGTMAVVGLFCLLIVKISLYLSLFSRGGISEPFLLTPAIGRWVMVVITSLYPYARSEEGTAKPFVEGITWRITLAASLILFLLAYGKMEKSGVGIAIFTLLGVLLLTQWASKKIGGITGDILGAANEISEIICLIALHWVIALPHETWTL